MTFRQRAEAWQAEAPIRAAQRARHGRTRRATGKLAGAGMLLVVAVLALLAVAALVALIVAAAGAWRILFACVVVSLVGLTVAKVRG